MSGNPRKRQLENELSLDDNNNGTEEEVTNDDNRTEEEVINDHNSATDIDVDNDVNVNANEHEHDYKSVENHEGNQDTGSHNDNDTDDDDDVDIIADIDAIDDNDNANDDDDGAQSSYDNPWNNCNLQRAIEEKETINTILELIELLPSEVKHKNKREEYPLHAACYYGHNYLVMKLIELYPEASKHKDSRGMYPLHVACRNYHSHDVVMKLIDIFPEAVLNSTRIGTALHLACSSTNISETIVRKLIEINPRAIHEKDDEFGRYPIQYAINSSQPIAIITLLLDGDPVGMKQRDTFDLRCNENLCSAACEANNADFISYLMQRSDYGINRTDRKEMTPLHYACDHLRDEILEIMFQYPDIDVNAANNYDDTPLHTTLRSFEDFFDTERCVNIVQQLLDHPFILIDQKNYDGETPLI